MKLTASGMTRWSSAGNDSSLVHLRRIHDGFALCVVKKKSMGSELGSSLVHPVDDLILHLLVAYKWDCDFLNRCLHVCYDVCRNKLVVG